MLELCVRATISNLMRSSPKFASNEAGIRGVDTSRSWVGIDVRILGPEMCRGQGGVDRAIRFEVTANEVNVIDRQGSELPYPRDLLFEDLAQFT